MRAKALLLLASLRGAGGVAAADARYQCHTAQKHKDFVFSTSRR